MLTNESLALLIAENASACLFMLDEKGIVSYINPSARSTTGFYSINELKDRPLHYFIHYKRPDGSDYPIEECPLWSVFSEKKKIEGEDVFLRKNGTFFPAKFLTVPINDGNQIVGAVVELIETTEIKSALHQRDEFINILSHELKTPITSLLLCHQLLKKRYDYLSKPEILRFIVTMGSQVSKMLLMIETLMDSCRSEFGNLTLHPNVVDLSALVKSVVSQSPNESIIKLNVHGSVFGVWDELRLEQVVSNLLTNAIKYGNKKPIEIDVHNTNGKAVLKVSDQGIGIPPSKVTTIFNKYSRATDYAKEKSLGLGLFVVKEIVSAHHGEIKVESTEGKGSTFIVTLPICLK